MRGFHYMVPTRYFSKTGINKFVRAYSGSKGLSRPLTLGQAHRALPIQYKPLAVAFSSKASSTSALPKTLSTSAHPLTAPTTFALVSDCEKAPFSYGVLLHDALLGLPRPSEAGQAPPMLPLQDEPPIATSPKASSSSELAPGLCGNVFHQMIPWKTPLPYTATEILTTAPGFDYVPRHYMIVACLQSPLEPFRPLATLWLDGVREAPAGVPRWKVTLHLDEYLRGRMTWLDAHTRAYAEFTFNGDLVSIDQARVKEVGSGAAEQDHSLLE